MLQIILKIANDSIFSIESQIHWLSDIVTITVR